MALDQEIRVKGLDELNRFLEQLPPRIARNVVRGGLRAGARVILVAARAKIHSNSGLLAKGLSVTTSYQQGIVKARMRTAGKHAYVAHWVEYGTAAHEIVARLGRGLSFLGRVFRRIMNPGAKPKPFMRPALDENAGRAVVAAGEYIRGRLSNRDAALALDAADVEIVEVTR